ncbi:hypothetical protein BDBG_03211 [Blastomyces gilchristii SLH14081]|uniref:Uncharacterized protein n=1 Tax=Blastomyces gilchristii (strain SLH14081) TaxID=559298 RepID=A0A179UIQ7_BLAGS|nr:uncharacterized protein BDBG_03211 [Blastomyces gilchristii SLH14081]OAT07109.1 hypothetical protein BDBG_03211 [Blastomyces gilchristii SLH14081]
MKEERRVKVTKKKEEEEEKGNKLGDETPKSRGRVLSQRPRAAGVRECGDTLGHSWLSEGDRVGTGETSAQQSSHDQDIYAVGYRF